MGSMQERITTTTKGSITSVQAIYVPADDLTDPAPATTLLTWMPQLSCLVVLLSWVSTLLWILLIPSPVLWIPTSLDQSTMKLPDQFKRSFRITNHFRILLLSWVWMNCLRKINLLYLVLVKFRSSCLSLSRLLRSSLVFLESLSP